MPDPSLAWLVEIETAIGNLKAFTQGMDQEAFLADTRTCSATAMQLIVVGEAASRLPPPVWAEAPEIPWPAIISLRNRIAHGYRTIDHRIVWDIAQKDIPALEAVVARMIANREKPGS